MQGTGEACLDADGQLVVHAAAANCLGNLLTRTYCHQSNTQNASVTHYGQPHLYAASG